MNLEGLTFPGLILGKQPNITEEISPGAGVLRGQIFHQCVVLLAKCGLFKTSGSLIHCYKSQCATGLTLTVQGLYIHCIVASRAYC